MTNKEKKELRSKILEKFTESNHPFFIQNEDKTINIAINTMDCIRIFIKLKELKEEPRDDPTLWSPFHLCTFNLSEMTVELERKSSEKLILVRGESYLRPRGEETLRADASNCNLQGDWPK